MNKLYKCVFKKNVINIALRSSSSSASNRNICNSKSKSFSTEQAAAKTTTTSETDSLSAAAADYKIIVPKRIHRSPTDILIALSATIGLDPTGPHYKYHDDPFLIPTSNASKRTFAMAQESGRKAEIYVFGLLVFQNCKRKYSFM